MQRPPAGVRQMAALEGRDIFVQDFIQQEIDNAEHEELSEIQTFFKDATVFITGGTGFVGRILIEKLLRTCNKIKKLYILIRAKKGKDMKERFAELFEGPVFERLKMQQSDFNNKVIPLSGDCGLENLGLSQQDRDTLVSEVDVVFHCAATVRFDEILNTAVRINVRGTKIVLDLAREMRNLKAFVYMSTAYSNCPRKEIGERFYEPPADYTKITNLSEILDNKELSVLTPTLLKDWPNTYTFTKIIAEDVVREYGQGLPIAVIRPSIVISTSKEPIAGWINNFYGPQGVVYGAGIGLLRTLHCSPDVLADMVPVDYVINATIALAWHIGQTRGDNPNLESVLTPETEVIGQETSDLEIPVLNYVSSEANPITWGRFLYLNYMYGAEIPSTFQLWYSDLKLNANYYVDLYYRYALHYTAALIVDGIMFVRGKKPMMWNAYKKIHKFSSVISYFATSQWKFRDQNVWKLWGKMSEKDKQLFDFNLYALDWEQYYYTYIRGLRLYLANEPISTVPEAKKKHKKLVIAHYSVLTVFYLLGAYILWCIFSRIFL